MKRLQTCPVMMTEHQDVPQSASAERLASMLTALGVACHCPSEVVSRIGRNLSSIDTVNSERVIQPADSAVEKASQIGENTELLHQLAAIATVAPVHLPASLATEMPVAFPTDG